MTRVQLCWLVLCHLDINTSHRKGGNLSGESDCIIFKISDWWGRVTPIVFGVTSRLMISGSISEQADKAMGSQLESTTPSWSLHQLLLPGSSPSWAPILTSCSDRQHCDRISHTKPFLPNLPLVMVLYHSNSNHNKDRLGSPKSFTIHTLLSCRSLCLLPSTTKRTFSDKNWVMHWSVGIAICH